MFLAGFRFALGMMTGIIVVAGILVGICVITDLVSCWRERRRRIERGMEVVARQAALRSSVLRQPEIRQNRTNLKIIPYSKAADTCSRAYAADSDRMPQCLFSSADFPCCESSKTLCRDRESNPDVGFIRCAGDLPKKHRCDTASSQ